MTSVFYVYILFDHCGIPRYVGKGRGDRWLQHEKVVDPNNLEKNEFIAETRATIGEIPKIKVRDFLTEMAAFDIEAALIRAIGRAPRGPLTNRTDNRNGPSSETIAAWHASRTPEQRSASARKGAAKRIANAGGPKAFGEMMRVRMTLDKRAAASATMSKLRAAQTQEDRSEQGRLAGLASSAAVSIEQKRARAAKGHATQMLKTIERRREEAKHKGLAKLTKEQLSANGKKGVAIANANRTHEQRVALAKKARAASPGRGKRALDLAPLLFD